MHDINLERMDLDQLKQLRKDVERAIGSHEKRKKQEALAAAEAAARESGYSLSELLGQAAKNKGKTINPPKYRHPDNPEFTWTGRGRRPDWIQAGLQSGKSLDDFLIVK